MLPMTWKARSMSRDLEPDCFRHRGTENTELVKLGDLGALWPRTTNH